MRSIVQIDCVSSVSSIPYLYDKHSEDDKACNMEYKCRVDSHPSITCKKHNTAFELFRTKLQECSCLNHNIEAEYIFLGE